MRALHGSRSTAFWWLTLIIVTVILPHHLICLNVLFCSRWRVCYGSTWFGPKLLFFSFFLSFPSFFLFNFTIMIFFYSLKSDSYSFNWYLFYLELFFIFFIKLHHSWVFSIKFYPYFFLFVLHVFLVIFFYRFHFLKLN
jgi:hypothetical protein